MSQMKCPNLFPNKCLLILLDSMGHSLVQEFITKDYQASVQAVLDRALEGVETA